MDPLVQAVTEAWQLAYGERMNELRDDRRARLLDERGLHPYSVVWGKIIYLEQQQELTIELDDSYSYEAGTALPSELRDAARAAASRDYKIENARDALLGDNFRFEGLTLDEIRAGVDFARMHGWIETKGDEDVEVADETSATT